MALEHQFSAWHRWDDRSKILVKTPGVYVLAVSSDALDRKAFSWVADIIYVGMTNSVSGLAARLHQFDETVRGIRCNHGGADRVRYKYRRFPPLFRKMFVAVAPIQCDVRASTAADLRAMGQVAKLEYDCLAEFFERHKCLPEFNDKKRSKKYSLTEGRKAAGV